MCDEISTSTFSHCWWCPTLKPSFTERRELSLVLCCVCRAVRALGKEEVTPARPDHQRWKSSFFIFNGKLAFLEICLTPVVK